MPVCGARLSYSLLFLSAWGVAQLSLTALLLHARSPAFVVDAASVAVDHHDANRLAADLDVWYSQSALNCWVASLLHLVTFCVSAQQVWMHQRVKEVESEQFY